DKRLKRMRSARSVNYRHVRVHFSQRQLVAPTDKGETCPGRGDCYLLLNIAVGSERNFDIQERVAFSTSRCAINRADWYLCQNFENRVFASDAVRGLNLNGIPTSQVAAKIAIAQQVGLSIHGWNSYCKSRHQ